LETARAPDTPPRSNREFGGTANSPDQAVFAPGYFILEMAGDRHMEGCASLADFSSGAGCPNIWQQFLVLWHPFRKTPLQIESTIHWSICVDNDRFARKLSKAASFFHAISANPSTHERQFYFAFVLVKARVFLWLFYH